MSIGVGGPVLGESKLEIIYPDLLPVTGEGTQAVGELLSEMCGSEKDRFTLHS